MSASDRIGYLDASVEVSDLLKRGIARASQLVLHPPLLPRPLHPTAVLDRLARRRERLGLALAEALSRRLDVLVPVVLTEVLSRARLTQMMRQYIDLDELVGAVDLDAAAQRLDLDAAVARVDLDAVAGRLDVNAVVNRLDLTQIVLERADLDRIVSAVLQRVEPADLTGLVEHIIDALDLTQIVLERVDLDRIVSAVLQRVEPADLTDLVEEIIDAIDLPEIIRESTGSMASDTVRGARMQGIAADEAVGRAVDRLLLRRRRRAGEDSVRSPSELPPSRPTWP